MPHMANPLEEGTGLNLQQRKFLAVVLEESFVLKNFYLTGGTALSSWYLHHRESYDLDLFTEKAFDSDQITNWIKSQQKTIGYRWLGVDEGWQFYTYLLRFPDNSRLKVDFGHYGAKRLQKGFVWNGLEIDSLYDIAVNKAQLFMTKPRERDYIDLYFILKNTGWKIEKLLAGAVIKSKLDYNVLQVAKNFFKAREIAEFPKMLVPFDPKAMEKFYLDLARSLKSQIFTS